MSRQRRLYLLLGHDPETGAATTALVGVEADDHCVSWKVWALQTADGIVELDSIGFPDVQGDVEAVLQVCRQT